MDRSHTRPSLHVLGSSPAWPNPGEPASSYLIAAGGARILVDCGSGAGAALLALDPAPVDAIVLSHLHFDHVADLVPLAFGLRFGPIAGWPKPRLVAPPGGLAALDRLTEAAGHGADHLQVFERSEYAPGEPLEIGGATLGFATMEHPGGSHAIRLEADGGVLCFSGDTSPTPALAVHARGADVLLCEAAAGEEGNPSPVHLRGSDAGRAAREAGVRRLVLTHVDVRYREAALAAARAVYAGPVELARPGLRVSC
jgi:ribonuclease BN (tRNA processing enzyme)